MNVFSNSTPRPLDPRDPDIVTRSFVRQFQIDFSKGVYRNRAAELKAIQDKITRALAKGKILDDYGD